MLLNLSIRDLAVVQALDLDFQEGLTVLTGETGAGKSILLTALGLALGDRADSGFIRPGASRAEINLSFALDDAPDAKAWLGENELLDEETGECLIRRVVGQDGRSKAFINGRPGTLQLLQELAGKLVEIHGQHAHLHLLQAGEQRRLLDGASDNQKLLDQIASVFREWRSTVDELAKLTRALETGTAREELLRYQIEELEQHDVETLDYPALAEEQTLQANVGRILGTGQAQLELLYEDERQSVNALLAQAVHSLQDIAKISGEFADPAALLQEAQIQVKEASLELRRKMEQLEADPQRLEWLESKLADLHRLARKHQVNPQELRDCLAGLRDELAGIEHGSEKIAALEARAGQLLNEYRELALDLSRRRRAGAERLQGRISAMIRELGMPQGQFLVEVASEPEQEPSLHGTDRIDFLVSANPGLPPRPLGKVASGGELARISLAIQVAATDAKTTPTLIFDEVDSGIGGAVAEIVGQKLRALGVGRQVFCVTHLHQVAVQGHNHLLVEKSSESGTTQTRVRELSAGDRKHEIARMLGGLRITEQTLSHAEEMLKGAAVEDKARPR